MPRPDRPGDRDWRTHPQRAVEWDCRNEAARCDHSSAVHTVDPDRGMDPLDPAAEFSCEVDGCGCRQLVPAPATLRRLGIHPSQVQGVR